MMSNKGKHTKIKGLSIAVVDDHCVFRKSLVHRLKRLFSQSHITEAKDGEEFLDLLKFNTYDLVLMDVKMPIMNGIEATARALQEDPTLKILALSTHDDPEFVSAMKDAGASGYLVKGGILKEMKSIIEQLLTGRQYFSF